MFSPRSPTGAIRWPWSWTHKAWLGSDYVSTQGSAVGRAGKIHVAFEGNEVIRVGGQSVTCISGTIALQGSAGG